MISIGTYHEGTRARNAGNCRPDMVITVVHWPGTSRLGIQDSLVVSHKNTSAVHTLNITQCRHVRA